MKIFRTFEDAEGINNPVVTTGSFDGVHIGHKAILKRLKILADKYNGQSVLITFNPHPRKVLYPDTLGKDLRFINSQEEKIELLREAGLDNVIIIDFTREFSKITGEQFIRDYLCGILHAKVIVAGFNHHFGFNQEGDYRQIWQLRHKYDFMAEEIPEQDVYNETVSSTKIRQAIREGYIQRANAYLDHYFIIRGKPVKDDYQNPELPLTFFRIPLADHGKLLPATGIYAVSFDHGGKNCKGMAVINCKTSGESEVLIHPVNNNLVIENNITVFFHKRIHGSIDLNDYFKSALRLKTSKDEISELIY